MTLATSLSRSTYPGPGSGPFAFLYKINVETDLRVTKRSATGIETTLNWPADFTVTGVLNASGNVTLTVAMVSGETLVIRRAPPFTQGMSIRNQGAYFPGTIEDGVDTLEMQIQSLKDSIDRSLKLKESIAGGASLTELEPTAGSAVTGTGTGFTMSAIPSGATSLPGQGRTVPTLSAFLVNNAEFNVLDYGAVADGVTDSRAAINAAITAALVNGGRVQIPTGTYLIGDGGATVDGYRAGIVVSSIANPDNSPLNRISIEGDGDSTILKASVANQVIVRWSAEHCHLNDVTIDGNELAGTVGLGVMGPNSLNATGNDNENLNRFENVFIRSCAEGALLKASGLGLAAWNNFIGVRFTGCIRAVCCTCTIVAGTPRANRNLFIGCEVSGNNSRGNTAYQVECGDTNQFYDCTAEDIQYGVLPNAIPTAFMVSAGGGSNIHTLFVGPIAENATRDFDNFNRRTKIFGGSLNLAKINGLQTIGFDALVGCGDIPSRLGSFLIGAADTTTNIELRDAMGSFFATALLGVSNGGGASPFNATGDLILQPRPGNDFILATSPTNIASMLERLRVPKDASGLKWPAAAVLSADPNTLDDYEEGSWTPTYLGSTGNPAITYNTQLGSYVKIGKMVYATFSLRTDVTSGGSGTLQIGGLPFTADASPSGVCHIPYALGFTTQKPVGGILTVGTSVVFLYYVGTATDSAVMTPAMLTTGAAKNEIQGTIIYRTAQ